MESAQLELLREVERGEDGEVAQGRHDDVTEAAPDVGRDGPEPVSQLFAVRSMPRGARMTRDGSRRGSMFPPGILARF